MSRSLSVIVPAYNEKANIVAALDNVTSALEGQSIDFEIIVVDDGSRDGTGELVRRNADRFAGVRLLVNERNMGFGATYRRGVEAATRDHVVMVHGDNAWGSATLRQFFARTGDADVIIGYTRNMWASRPLGRTLLSRTFTLLVNLITGRRLKYYNGVQIHRADVLKSMTIHSAGYGFQPEVLLKALSVTRTYIEVPMDLIEREHGESKAFRLKNAIDVLRTLRRLRRVAVEGIK
jgi:glycosyltransferase involved in cell wall biosynthesis